MACRPVPQPAMRISGESRLSALPTLTCGNNPSTTRFNGRGVSCSKDFQRGNGFSSYWSWTDWVMASLLWIRLGIFRCVKLEFWKLLQTFIVFWLSVSFRRWMSSWFTASRRECWPRVWSSGDTFQRQTAQWKKCQEDAIAYHQCGICDSLWE